MLRPKVQIIFQQVKTDTYPDRTDTFVMDFITECEIDSSWKNLTDTCKLKFPKNIFFKRSDGSTFTLQGKALIATDANTAPFFMRGDKITVKAIYWYEDESGNEQTPELREIYTGYVTKINVKMPVEIECEDNMYKLKQIAAPNKLFKASEYYVEKIVKELIGGTGFNFVDAPEGIQTNVGDFRTQNETVAQVLERLRKDYRIESWFRGNDLHCSGIVYYPSETNPTYPIFVFQNNIIDDDLVYTRQDDIRLGIKAYSINKVELSSTNLSGHKKTSHKRLETTVGSTEGEIRTLYFWDVPDVETLKKMATDRLSRFYFEGFRGSFTTFGEPYVKHGDIVTLRDNVMPERNGEYFVRSVTRTTGTQGYRQKIELDIRVDGNLTVGEISQGI